MISTLISLCIGALVGIAAGAAQIGALRYGVIAAAAQPIFWACFATAGAVLAAVGARVASALLGALGGRAAARRAGSVALGGGVAVVVFAFLVPWNLRGPPDVYLLVTDTTRADHLSLYGYERETTPFLEELARESVVFTNMVSQGSHTIVSTPCLLASCYPSDHGVKFSHQVLPDRLKLISEYLAERGYQTYGYAANPHLTPGHGYAQGFETYDHDPTWRHTPAAAVNRAFSRWLDAADDRPLFAFLFYIDSHNPYAPPDEWKTRFPTRWSGAPISNWNAEWDATRRPLERESLVSQYDAAIAYWDAEFRALTLEIEARRGFDDALIVYTSDHGEEFWEHGEWGHNRTLFGESIRVPLLISFPVPIRFPPLPRPSGVVSEVVSSVDVLPTILEYLGIEPDSAVRGRSALALALGRDDPGPERIAYCEEILGDYGPYDVRAVRTRDHKYVRVLDYEGDHRRGDLFFDLASDRGEHSNLAAAGGDEADRLRRMLDAHLAEMERLEHPENSTLPIGPHQRRRLEALGYVLEDR